jgi:hypothetical protein
MAKKRYNLNIDEFDSVVNSFTGTIGNFEVSKETPKGEIIYRFNPKGQRFCSVLTCYISQGRVSFLSSGKDKKIADDCMTQLLDLTAIEIRESKSFTVKSASIGDIETATDFLLTEYECSIETIENENNTIESTFRVIGKYGDIIHFTYYKSGTLLVQGRPGITFENFIEIAIELFNPIDVKKEHFKFFDISEGDEIINSSLAILLPDAYDHIGMKLDAIMAPSLILLNQPKQLTDYTAYAFPVLRGTEGVLKSIFLNEGVPIKDFGEFFEFDRTKNKCVWTTDGAVLFGDADVRKSLLDLYRFYHAQRHTLFHIDATITASRTLDYDDALALVNEGLRLINEVYAHLN